MAYDPSYYVRNKDKVDAKNKAWANANRERLKLYRRKYDAENRERREQLAKESYLRRKYGLTLEKLKEMLEKQNNKCANIGCPDKATDIDHNHITGKIREMLCHNCNTALGMLREDAERIMGLFNYAEDHK